MPKVKAKRQSVSLDMTAMCDVAFLLLTFFMLTAKFKPEEAVTITPPTSISEKPLPTKDGFITISVGPDGGIFLGTDDKAAKERLLNEHINSIRRHIKDLSSKEYQNLYGLQSLDFVLMFIAIEPAFALAVQNDASLFYDAFERNIIIVSPSTLLATLRTISSIWKQEKQNKNALEIAKKGGRVVR